MNRQELIMQLAELPKQIEEAENKVIKAVGDIQVAKDKLLAKEDEMYLTGVIDGKNAEIRSAQLREKTSTERQAIQQAENALSAIRVVLNRLNNRLAVNKAIAAMLKAGE